jgi:hypothetical protein
MVGLNSKNCGQLNDGSLWERSKLKPRYVRSVPPRISFLWGPRISPSEILCTSFESAHVVSSMSFRARCVFTFLEGLYSRGEGREAEPIEVRARPHVHDDARERGQVPVKPLRAAHSAQEKKNVEVFL